MEAAAAITVGDGAGGDPRRSSPFFYCSGGVGPTLL